MKSAITIAALLATCTAASNQTLPEQYWPVHDHWRTSLAKTGSNKPLCILSNANDDFSLTFAIQSATDGSIVTIYSSLVEHEIPSTKINMLGDGLYALNLVPTHNDYQPSNGKMTNITSSLLNTDQLREITSIFTHSKMVNVDVGFIIMNVPTSGFLDATNDFIQCLEQVGSK